MIYYLALANSEMGRYEEAAQLAKEGLELQPSLPELSELFGKLMAIDKRNKENEKCFCSRMFPGFTKIQLKADTKEANVSISSEIREHVTEEIARLQKETLQETPMRYELFSDKINMGYLKAEAEKAGFSVDVKPGRRRPIVRLCRPKPV